ncbi:MAG: 50S ribosomal protein L35 [Candidatus Caenarcaniphilales bacterium]|nr:50S ribosomal protein L35 [Candidatus Caenarcaniphilales bacterium]
MAVKYKLKTNKAVSKRFKKTASGKFLAKQSGIKHINTHMRSKVKRKLRRHKALDDVNAKRLNDLLPYA